MTNYYIHVYQLVITTNTQSELLHQLNSNTTGNEGYLMYNGLYLQVAGRDWHWIQSESLKQKYDYLKELILMGRKRYSTNSS